MRAKDLRQQDLIDYAVGRSQAGNAPATIYKMLVYFHAALERALMQGKIPVSTGWQFKGIGKKLSGIIGQVKRERQDVFSPEQIQPILGSTSNKKHRAIFEILLHTGMRKGELNKLVWGDVKDGVVTIRAEISKTYTRSIVPLNKYSAGAFDVLRSLNPRATEEERILDYSLARRSWGDKEMRKACDACGAPYGSTLRVDDENPAGGAGWHTWRHTFITHATTGAWIPESVVRALTGHVRNGNGRDAHAGYIHPTPENLATAIERWTMWYEATLPVQPLKIDDALTTHLLAEVTH